MTTVLDQLEEKANQCRERNDLAGTRQALDQALAAALVAPGPDLGRLGRILNNLGFTHREMHDYPAAEQYFRRAVDAYRQMGVRDNPELANTLQHLGRMAQYRQDYDTVWACWAEALEIWKRFITTKERAGYIPYMASCLCALGEYFADTQNYAAARQNFEQALKLREASLPAGHADIAENLYFLAMLCATTGDLTAAQGYLKRAIPLYAQELGRNHELVRELYGRLQDVEQKLGTKK